MVGPLLKNLFIIFVSLVSATSSGLAQGQYLNADSVLQNIKKHLTNGLSELKPNGLYPRSYNVEQSMVLVNSSDWTSGFYPGMLWYMFEYTRDSFWKKQAERWTSGLEFEKYNTRTHDLGFMLYCSFGNGYRLTQRPHYKNVLVQAAKSLASRYNQKVGCIQSWDQSQFRFPVIVDNMMNLELLFWAAKATGDEKYYKIAVDHANTTMANHYRKDGSAYHVVDYDPSTGRVISRKTVQGYADESSWARGQAWGLYGFTMAYRETGEQAYLAHAEKIASYFIRNLPRNKIPYWDFNAPNIPFEFQDASAAAIAASALLELSTFSSNYSAHYFNTALEMLSTLCSPAFFAAENSNGHFLLKRGVGFKPEKIEVDAALIFSDYYLLEALLRYYLIINR